MVSIIILFFLLGCLIIALCINYFYIDNEEKEPRHEFEALNRYTNMYDSKTEFPENEMELSMNRSDLYA